MRWYPNEPGGRSGSSRMFTSLEHTHLTRRNLSYFCETFLVQGSEPIVSVLLRGISWGFRHRVLATNAACCPTCATTFRHRVYFYSHWLLCPLDHVRQGVGCIGTCVSRQVADAGVEPSNQAHLNAAWWLERQGICLCLGVTHQ